MGVISSDVHRWLHASRAFCEPKPSEGGHTAVVLYSTGAVLMTRNRDSGPRCIYYLREGVFHAYFGINRSRSSYFPGTKADFIVGLVHLRGPVV